jgi:ketosteroid isomerase-like protein
MEDIMSNANIKLVQDAYAAFGKGDLPAILDMMTPDVTMGIVGRTQDAPFLGIHSGKAGVMEFFKLLDEAHAISKFEPQRFLAAEEKVFVWGRYAWTMRKSGVSDETEWLHVLSVRDGKISAWLGYNDTAMLAAAYHGAPAAKRAAKG